MKQLDIINDSNYELNNRHLKTVVDLFVKEKLIKADDEIYLKFTENMEIMDLNKRYRGKNSKTDVLSFPSEFKEIPFLGDILVDMSVADQQKGNKTIDEEVSELLIHGILHLLGYDHINENEKN